MESAQFFYINHTGVEDKFVNSILHASHFNAWRRQSDFNFNFVLTSDQLLSDTDVINEAMDKCPFTIHEIVRATSKPNFMQARFPVDSQLKMEAWNIICRATGRVN